MYRTLYFRYTSQRKYDELLSFLFEGASKFLDLGQRPEASDLAILLVGTLDKVQDVDELGWTQKMCTIIRRIGPDVVERETLLANAVKWAGTKQTAKTRMHHTVAGILWDEGNMELAKHHYLMSAADGKELAKMLIQLSEKGFAREVDLFIVHTVLQQLCLKQKEVAGETFGTYTKYHPSIANTEPPFNLPLLNFVFFLLKAIDQGRLAVFKALCELYKPSIERDPAYDKYLSKIGVIFFNAPQVREASGPGGIFGDLISQLFQGLDEQDEIIEIQAFTDLD